MKLTKSILSPGQSIRDSAAPVSLSSSLSRRMRTNGSLKGSKASPFFTAPGRKRGCGFESAEPTSPKVTCIGQVRVKTKKKVKQTRSLSKRRSGGASFRKMEHVLPQPLSPERLAHKNPRWVLLPVSICEGLSCLFPCRSWYSSLSEWEKAEEEGSGGKGCGAVFTRWRVSVNDGKGGKRREIELVVGGGDEEELTAESVSMRSSRRRVFDDIEVKGDRIEVKGQSLEGEEEAARVSICIPPKNALLLMRCRSDPMKMASLASGFSWDAQPESKLDDEEDKDGAIAGNGEFAEENGALVEDQDEVQNGEIGEDFRHDDGKEKGIDEGNQVGEVTIVRIQEMEVGEEARQETVVMNEDAAAEAAEEDEFESNMPSFEALLDQENGDRYEDYRVQPPEEDAEKKSVESVTATIEFPKEKEEESREESVDIAEKSGTLSEKDEQIPSENEKIFGPENQETATHEEEEAKEEPLEPEFRNPEKQSIPPLPDCLLLMMCEPKLSTEVSEEKWVCGADFVRWLPERPPKPVKPAKGEGGDHVPPLKRRLSADSRPKGTLHTERNDQYLREPRRSSCSLPLTSRAAAPTATLFEQKLANAVAYEPLMLTRCKSEPMGTASSKLVPDSLFWQSSIEKLEPHRQATVGAAGVGF